MILPLLQNGVWKNLEANEGDNLYRVLLANGYAIEAPCGGRCFCGKCRVIVQNGGESQPGERDYLTPTEIAMGFRLACAVIVVKGMKVQLDATLQADIQVEGDMSQVQNDPVVKIVKTTLPSPTLQDPKDDWARLQDLIGPLDTPSIAMLQEIAMPYMAIFDQRVALAGRHEAKAYGIAIDIGTTTVVCYLMDLIAGQQVGAIAALNAQRSAGSDVITRCSVATTKQGLWDLSQSIRRQLAGMIAQLCEQEEVALDSVYHVSVVGNTVMLHLLMEISVAGIAVAPFAPIVTRGLAFCGLDLDFGLPRAVVSILPSIAGYVGADTVAAALACGLDQGDAPRLLVDIGTNGEMVLSYQGMLYCCSTAAGPAFEGAHIACGVAGVAGAIAKVWYQDGDLHFGTIADQPAIGLCGSGLVDVVAVLCELGAIDETGRLEDSILPERHGMRDGKPIFHLTEQVYLVQRDLREVQLAKGAIAAGIEILIKQAGLQAKDIQKTYLAGGFGSHIDPKNACGIGLLLKELEPSICAVGNAAGAGARMTLLDTSMRERAESLRRKMQYIELSMRPDFQDRFVEHMMF